MTVERIDIGTGAAAELKPGGLHIILMGLRRQLREHDIFPLTLTFTHAGSAEIEVQVEKAGATESSN